MKVLLAVDGSGASMSAVATTAALRLPPGSAIEVLSVIPETFAPEGSPWPNVIRVDPPADRERVRDDVKGRLVAIAEGLRREGTTVEARVLEGRPATEIVLEAAAFDADLIVMGARGLSAVRRLVLGSVSSEVADHASCPVLIARRDALGRVLWATDGSAESGPAGAFIRDSGLFDDAEIRVISVPDSGAPWWSGMSPIDGAASISIYAEAIEVAEHRATKAADEGVATLAGKHVSSRSPRATADVPSTILAEAESWAADVIVVGARPIGPMQRWLLGSVSRYVLHHADASVLIVRPRVSHAGQRERLVTASV